MVTRASLIAQLVKKFACNAGDPGSIPGLGRSAREGIGYPPRYSWASLAVQLIENPPAMRETCIRSLGWGRSPAEGKGYPFQYSDLENSMGCIVHGVARSQTRLSHFHLWNIHFYVAKPSIFHDAFHCFQLKNASP